MIPRIINTIKTIIEQPEPPPKPQTPPLTDQEKDQVVLGLPVYPDAIAKALEAKLKFKK